MKLTTLYFCVAEHYISISFVENQINSSQLIRSFKPFQCEQPQDSDALLFQLVVDDTLTRIPQNQCKPIRDFDTGNGITVVEQLKNGGYQYVIRNVSGNDCCLLQTDKTFKHCQCALNGNYNMRNFGLNNALMLIFSFAGCRKQTLLIHASLVRQNGYGYAFTAKSGTGKSTQVSMWLRYIEGCDLMNDDNPAIRIINGKTYIYGTPWSGKTPCYRNIKAKLGAITLIDRAKENKVEYLTNTKAFAMLLPSCSGMKWDEDINNFICNNVIKIIDNTNTYILHCLPNKEAAEVCHQAIAR